MVNFGLNGASILGLFLVVAGAALYFLRSVRPELSRDHDIFFTAIGLVCGFILLFQGWRLDPILQFSQLLLTGSAIFFAVESVRLRGVATEQARRSTPIVDDDRPVSRVYRAELDQLEPYDYGDRDPRLNARRLRGTQDSRPSRPRPKNERYGEEPPSRPTGNRRPSRPSRDDRYGEWGDAWADTPPNRPSRRPRPEGDPYGGGYEGNDYGDAYEAPKRPRRRRPGEESPAGMETMGDAYVDYQPLDDVPNEDRRPDDEDRPTPPVNFDY